jgi:signal transduction histidine kinase
VKLSLRFFLILLAFSLVPVMVTGVWVLRSQTAARENSRQFHLQMTQLAAETVDSFAADTNRSLGFAQELERVGLVASQGKGRRSSFPKGTADVGSDEYRILQREAANHPGLSLLSLLGPDGRETLRFADSRLYPATDSEDRSADPLVREARTSGLAAWGKVQLRRGEPVLPVVHPLPQGRLLYVECSLSQIFRRVRDRSLGAQGRLFLIDEAGRPLPGYGGDLPEPRWPQGTGPRAEAAGWSEDVPTAKGAAVAAWAPRASLGWQVISLQPRSEALAVGPHFRAQAMGFLLALAILVVLGASWMGARLAAPLRGLIAGAQRAARSEFASPVPESGWGELSALTRGFNAMMQTLRNYQEMQVDRLLEEKAKVEALVHTIPDGIVLAGFDGKIAYMNITARSLLRAEAGDVAKPGTAPTIHGTFRDPVLRQALMSLMTRKKVSELREVELRGPDGKRLGIFSCRLVAVMRDKREVGIVVTLRDVTAERELVQLREEFYHGIVHDLRGPLTSIDGFTTIMRARMGKLAPEQINTYLGYVSQSAQRMRQLVADILDTAKIESGTMELKIEPSPAADFAERIKGLYALQEESLGVKMSFDASGAPARPLCCDRNLVDRVLMNLVGNAVKFTPKGGRVDLRVAAAGADAVEFSVQDTGPGVPKDKLEFVFEKFKQLDGQKKSAGYGLGLSICKKIVELHQGRIWCESEPGQGSRFVFRLPLERPASGQPATPPSA